MARSTTTEFEAPEYQGEGFAFCIAARWVPFLSYWYCWFWGLAGW